MHADRGVVSATHVFLTSKTSNFSPHPLAKGPRSTTFVFVNRTVVNLLQLLKLDTSFTFVSARSRTRKVEQLANGARDKNNGMTKSNQTK